MSEPSDANYLDYPFPNGWHLIPRHMHASIYEYVMRGTPVGSFLHAILADHPISYCFACADEENQRQMLGWMKFLYNYMPGPAKGSDRAVTKWISQGGLAGVARKDL